MTKDFSFVDHFDGIVGCWIPGKSGHMEFIPIHIVYNTPSLWNRLSIDLKCRVEAAANDRTLEQSAELARKIMRYTDKFGIVKLPQSALITPDVRLHVDWRASDLAAKLGCEAMHTYMVHEAARVCA